MVPSPLAAAGGLLLLFSLSSAQTRGDSVSLCAPNDGFGKYCPTTCGVADYLLKYMPGVDRDLSNLQRDLESIANLTQGAEEKIVHMKDSTTSAQKSSIQDPLFKKSSSMLDDVIRFEKTIVTQEQQIFDLQNLISSNERRMADLKQLSIQLQQTCSEPCKDTVEIQTITGTDCQDISNKGATTSGLYYVKPLKATEQFLVYCEIDSFGRGFTVIQRRRDGSVDFHKDWNQFKQGFGYLSPDDTTEFWLGNEKTHLLTDGLSIPTVLRIELVDWEGNKRYADYTMFKLGSEADMYRLTYGFYLGGDAGDAFAGFDFGDDPSDKFYTSHNGMQFSTFDKDNDKYDGNCAQQDGSGWWMNRCHAAHLNGKYYQGGQQMGVKELGGLKK
ncbi:putative fibrinogen gamma chain isoform 4 [Scophthalmus maximus]|uniref:Putative fibrinogen gamma chain isoform 4 n=1 Tax=Scophthalmus maximus TaxID=52904 RepID=A0A2U9BN03_SCOMX|nr:putative fibrinogen gamma chain isoform 4 [Scophthalmus maximus]